MLHSRVVLGLALLGASIVVPGYTAVNGSSVGSLVADGRGCRQWSDGSPMPIPKPAKGGVADGSPMPIPKPSGKVFRADGSPMPIPKPTGSTARAA